MCRPFASTKPLWKRVAVRISVGSGGAFIAGVLCCMMLDPETIGGGMIISAFVLPSLLIGVAANELTSQRKWLAEIGYLVPSVCFVVAFLPTAIGWCGEGMAQEMASFVILVFCSSALGAYMLSLCPVFQRRE